MLVAPLFLVMKSNEQIVNFCVALLTLNTCIFLKSFSQ